MSFYFFIFQIILLFLFVFCTLCVPNNSVQAKKTDESAELFRLEEQLEAVEVSGGETEINKKITLNKITFPFIFAVKKGIVTVFEGSYTSDVSSAPNPVFDFITTYVDTANREADWGKDFITKTRDKWKVQLSKQYNEEAKKFSLVISSVVSGDDKIYIFAVSNTATSAGVSDASQLKVTVIKGTLDDNKKNIIKWEKLKDNDDSLVKKFTEIFKNIEPEKSPFDTSAFLTAEGKPVFIFRGKAKNSDKNAFAIISLKKNEENKMDILYSETDQNCYSYFFPWGNKVMMISTNCNFGGEPTIQESANMNDWNGSSGTFSRLLDAFQNKEKFATVKINKKEVLLFTQKKCVDNKLSVCLWISDGSRLATFDIIINGENIQCDGSIFYTDNELFALYQKNGASDTSQEKKTIVLKRLKDVMDKINTVLGKWENSEKLVLELCGENQPNAKISCEDQLPTDGLVGFLSGKAGGDDKKWEDNYNYVTATVKGGNKITDGFTFSGLSAGAQWTVSKNELHYLYNFAKYGFTLLATVTINKVTQDERPNSVLGVCVNNKGGGSKTYFRLWCTKDNYWGVSNLGESDIVKTNKICNKDNSYVVGLTLEKEKRNIIVYVDGEQLSTASSEKSVTVPVEPEDIISYFYFGVDTSVNKQDNAESQISVQNVLLYNLIFDNEKLEKIEAIKVENHVKPVEGAKFTVEGDGEGNAQVDEESTSGDDTPETLATLLPTEEVVLSTSQRESAVYINVSVMCGVWLMLFVVTHYQYV